MISCSDISSFCVNKYEKLSPIELQIFAQETRVIQSMPF